MKIFLAALLLAAGLFCPCAHAQQSDPISNRLQKQFEETKAKAERGDAKAQFELGEWYAGSSGLEKNQAEAMKWFRKASEQGYAIAQFSLGHGYLSGEGVEKDYAEAAKWFRKAAEQGFDSAQYYLGQCYLNGQGVEKDAAEAMKWYRKAAEQDFVNAQFMLGNFFAGYISSSGVEKDDVESYAWYNLASKTEKGAAKARDALEQKLSSQQVGDAQKRTKELRAQIEARRKSGR